MEKEDVRYILITSTNFPNAGAGANYLNLFCKGLSNCGIKVQVFLLKSFAFGEFKTAHKRHNLTDYGIPFSYLGYANKPGNVFFRVWGEIKVCVNLVMLLFKLLPDRRNLRLLIYNNEFHYNIFIYLLAKLLGVKVISFVPEFYDKSLFGASVIGRTKWIGFLLNFYYLNKWSYRLIVFSFYLRDRYLQKGFTASDIIVQPNLTDFEYWKTNSNVRDYDLGFSGTPCEENGLIDLFKAASLLKREGKKISILVIGDNAYGQSYIPALKDVCEKLNIKDNVTFKGLVENLEEVRLLLSHCSVLTLTKPCNLQTQASFPTRLGEYFATKRKVLVTDFGDIERYFIPDEDLVVAKCGDAVSIANKINWMLENDRESSDIATCGFDKAKSLLEYQVSVKKIADFIN